MAVDDGDNANLEQAFSWRTTVALPREQAEVEDGYGYIAEDMDEFIAHLLVESGIGRLDPGVARPEVEVHFGGYFVTLPLTHFEVSRHASCDGDREDDADQGPVDEERESATPEAGELDTVELPEPFGFAGREGAHG